MAGTDLFDALLAPSTPRNGVVKLGIIAVIAGTLH